MIGNTQTNLDGYNLCDKDLETLPTMKQLKKLHLKNTCLVTENGLKSLLLDMPWLD